MKELSSFLGAVQIEVKKAHNPPQFVQSASATLLFYEPFATNSYNNGAFLASGAGQWNRGGSSSAGCSIVTNTSALSYSGLVASNSSRGLLRVANSVASNRHAGADLSAAQTINAQNPGTLLFVSSKAALIRASRTRLKTTPGFRSPAAAATSPATRPSSRRTTVGTWLSR